MIVKEYIKNTIDYLETKKISDIDFETRVLNPVSSSSKDNFAITKFKGMTAIPFQSGSTTTEVWINPSTFEPEVEIYSQIVDSLDYSLSFMVSETNDEYIEVIKVRLKGKEIPLEFVRTDETDPSIVSLTTIRELGKETNTEPFSL